MMTFSVCGTFPTFNTLETVIRKKTKMIINLGFSLAILVINGDLSEGNELYFTNVRFPFCKDKKSEQSPVIGVLVLNKVISLLNHFI